MERIVCKKNTRFVVTCLVHLTLSLKSSVAGVMVAQSVHEFYNGPSAKKAILSDLTRQESSTTSYHPSMSYHRSVSAPLPLRSPSPEPVYRPISQPSSPRASSTAPNPSVKDLVDQHSSDHSVKEYFRTRSDATVKELIELYEKKLKEHQKGGDVAALREEIKLLKAMNKVAELPPAVQETFELFTKPERTPEETPKWDGLLNSPATLSQLISDVDKAKDPKLAQSLFETIESLRAKGKDLGDRVNALLTDLGEKSSSPLGQRIKDREMARKNEDFHIFKQSVSAKLSQAKTEMEGKEWSSPFEPLLAIEKTDLESAYPQASAIWGLNFSTFLSCTTKPETILIAHRFFDDYGYAVADLSANTARGKFLTALQLRMKIILEKDSIVSQQSTDPVKMDGFGKVLRNILPLNLKYYQDNPLFKECLSQLQQEPNYPVAKGTNSILQTLQKSLTLKPWNLSQDKLSAFEGLLKMHASDDDLRALIALAVQDITQDEKSKNKFVKMLLQVISDDRRPIHDVRKDTIDSATFSEVLRKIPELKPETTLVRTQAEEQRLQELRAGTKKDGDQDYKALEAYAPLLQLLRKDPETLNPSADAWSGLLQSGVGPLKYDWTIHLSINQLEDVLFYLEKGIGPDVYGESEKLKGIIAKLKAQPAVHAKRASKMEAKTFNQKVLDQLKK